ncbi:MAG TPA: patatin-like phospholipase family protein [Candidatus Krumholzibacteria bacterium]|nr:patatin-like phospholipase family protein [Candidatus Krumholzibacteria bacterium]
MIPQFRSDEKVGLVLGGGGARGLAAIGIVEVLHEAGLRPTRLAGTSMGAMVGAFLAAGYAPKEIRELAASLSWIKVIDVSVRAGLIRGDKFLAWLREYLPATFAELEIPLTCTATDIDSGELIYLSDGDLPLAIRATCAFPGAFEPVKVGERNLVDGGLKSTVPVLALRGLGLDRVVACDFQPPLDRPVVDLPEGTREMWAQFWETLTFRRRALAADILLKAVDILQTEVARHQLAAAPPDLLIAPRMPDINIEDFRLADRIIGLGADEARRALKRLADDRA